MSEDLAQNSGGATTTSRREYLDHATAQKGQGDPSSADPDVLLDLPVLKVGGINLGVKVLRAHVAVLAELADLMNLSVGVDARLEEAKLALEDVEAQALLKV